MKKKLRDLTRGKQILFWVISILISLIFLEIASGIVAYLAVTDSQKQFLEKLKQNSENYFTPHPYALYMPTPGFEAYGKKQHNSLGFRGKEIDPTADNFTIFCLGGSTTYGWLQPDPEKTFPVYMGEALKGERQDLQVINAGLPMGASPEILATFQYRVLPLKPDLLFLHMGLNDIFPTLMPKYKSDYSHDRKSWVASKPDFMRRNSYLLNSNLIKLVYLAFSQPSEQNTQVDFVKPEHADWPKFCVAGDAGDPNRYAGFENNLRSLLAICEANKVPVVLTPTNIRQSDLNHYKAMQKAYTKNIQIMKKLAGECDNVHFFDSRTIGIPDMFFADICHMKREGMEAKGFAFADFIKSKKLLEKNLK